MKIGIIGAGHMGSALAGLFSQLGYEVRLANSRDPGSLRGVAELARAQTATCAGAVLGAELVVLALPIRQVAELPPQLFASRAPGAPIIDATNYVVRRDGWIAPLMDLSCVTESEWVEQQIGAPVVKAFNNMMARHLIELGRPPRHRERLALPFFGEAGRGKRLVSNLINSVGFDPVDGGSIEQSWRSQIGTPVFCSNLRAIGVLRALSQATVQHTLAYREAVLVSEGEASLRQQ
ncbi:MAG TPA: NAD(P)-binding domain-containing protein [Polyangiaceae bacterium]|nr:NAD(P)-binding domain-containing protein [Polyangiaceae bacterium]